MTDPPAIITVVVPVPGLGPLTYRVPPDTGPACVGMRALVPLGRRTVTGCIIEVGDATTASANELDAELKPILDLLDEKPFLPRDVLDLALWVSDYYAAGPGEAVAAAMPPMAWVESQQQVTITEAGAAALRAGDRPSRQSSVLRALAGGAPHSLAALARASSPAGSRPPSREAAASVRTVVHALAAEGLVSVEQALRGRARAFRTRRVVRLTAAGHDVAERLLELAAADAGGADPVEAEGGDVRFGSRQREALGALRGRPDGMPTSQLASRGVAADAIRRLAARGLVSIERHRVERDPFVADRAPVDAGGSATAGGPRSSSESANARESALLEPTAEQARALGRLTELASTERFAAAVLHGVTGSGKTEVYVRLASAVRQRGRSVLVLVPEIALTPAVVARFRAAFGEAVAIQHSGLAAGERHDQWHRIRDGHVSVVVGTRSAVFAPVASLGLVIVDEEHDTSYKQEESPRYHGRDVAVVRAQRAGALVVLGSATPSLETYRNALDGRYELVSLERRVLDRPLPSVEVVSMREECAEQGPDVVLSRRLLAHLDATLSRGEQAMLLLNRRGFSTAVFCRQCAETLECPNCSVSLTVHRAARRARCHYCNYSMPVPSQCPSCGGPFLEQMGFGTERVETVVREHAPRARVARLDRDTVRRRGAILSILGRFARRELDVLVGTQMVAKGHDFPAVTLVGVISADVGLGLADFRAAERTFQLLTQVAGRAGRGDRAGLAVIQTLHPGHYSIQHACRQDYAGFFEEESRFRTAMRYPPAVSLVNAIVRAPTLGVALEDAAAIVRQLRRHEGFRVLGPAPAPFGKLRGEHRAQFLMKGPRRGVMRRALLAALEDRADVRRRITIDIDPLSVL